jgi:lauroyl/myristoyl acyltransferase
MTVSLRALRRAAMQFAIARAIATTGPVPIGLQRSAVRSLVAVAGGVPMLRLRVRENMRLALGPDVAAGSEQLYFRHLGWFLANSLATFHHGVASTPVVGEVRFDESVRVLDEAAAEGRGVVITSPHWSGHELVAAIVNRRHPVAALVRQAAEPERMKRKLKWYKALGIEIVLRPSGASTIRDAAAYLKVLRSRKVLAITPDLLAEPSQGIGTCIFGRQARLHGGAFALAIKAKAPMIRCSFRWQSEASVTVIFDRARLADDAGDLDAAVCNAVLDWCGWFEEKLRASPENWQFWLDKRWSGFLRETPRIRRAE